MKATDEERQAVWESLLLRSTRGVLKRGDIVATAAYFYLTRFVVAHIWERSIRSMGTRVAAVVKSRKNARKKKLDRAALCSRLAEVPINDRETQRRVEAASTVNTYLIQRLIKEGFLRRTLRQTRPLLTPAHKLARLRFYMEHVQLGGNGEYFFNPMYDVVHMDGKWFYVKKIGLKVYLLTGKDGTPAEEPPVQYVHSKR
ncbi:hypothetical protein PF008_g30229 [Phytophthora fragariae]|uniref:DUF7769 domain-containing protein n=1 Tax=Phytophthora fragariae TaxID=53985 RepID=A0A6G0Q667_9STRA|nr:hypothetical protein PF008_g30229 [Phytophthora fragariae]